MDILDIMLARAMTPQGKTETYVAKAEKAAQDAAAAQASATAAIQTVESAADEIAAAREEAASLLTEAQEALETAQSAQINTIDFEDVQDEIKNLDVSANMVEGANANTIQVITTYPDDTLHTENLTKLYKGTGSNEDGTMTQKAITDALGNKMDSFILSDYATKQYVNQQVGSGGGSGASINMDPADAGHIVTVDEDGNLIASMITEDMLLSTLVDANTYVIEGAVGLDMNYTDKTFTRIQYATHLTMGTDFDQFTMYGGRIKCNVADNGTINAFYGQSSYKEDGTNGQVMIYQPKFYYKRIPYVTENSSLGKIIRHEALILSATAQPGFKLAPIFNDDLDYILLPAYDGSLIDNKLASIAGATPITNISITDAEAYANARGTGWHIMNMAAESANQMLEMVEFGTMNGQSALGKGIVAQPGNAGSVCYFITGSTAGLGNGSGVAESTDVSINGTVTTQTEEGKKAIAYRGMENPWGNLWSLIGGLNIHGNGQERGGVPYVCTDFNYTPTTIGENYESVGFALPMDGTWISAMGISNIKYDWIFMPIECANSANSLLPIGDGLWTSNNLSGTNIVATGGSYGYNDACGPFYYAADRNAANSARTNYGAKLLYIPTKNNIYTANINKWSAYMGG